jgi:uncharacterized membrane protein YeaQ/YmgE (transglycosylase-associated protein family)
VNARRRASAQGSWADGLGWLVSCAYGAFAFGIVGCFAGALAGRVLEPRGYEFIEAEIVWGMLGAMVGALLGGAWLLAGCPWPRRRRAPGRRAGPSRD